MPEGTRAAVAEETESSTPDGALPAASPAPSDPGERAEPADGECGRCTNCGRCKPARVLFDEGEAPPAS